MNINIFLINKNERGGFMKKYSKGNFFGYNTLKGRLLFALIFGALIAIDITIIDTKALHSLHLNYRTAEVEKYIDLMSIFVFVNGVLFMFYSSMGVYDAITFMTSEKVYAPKIFFLAMIVLGICQAFMGIDTVMRLFEMNALIVNRDANTYKGVYLFGAAIKCLLYSLLMYAIRMISEFRMRKSNEKMFRENHELRHRKKQLEDFLNESGE